MKKPIIRAPHPTLALTVRPVDKLDRKTHTVIEDMKETLAKAIRPKGVGLAAVQINVPLSIFVMRPSEKDPITVYINPVITNYSKEVTTRRSADSHLEGCLSIPEIWGTVARSVSVRLKYMDENGITQEKEFKDFPARIIQHEVDHLNGILYTQRVLEQKGTLYRPEKDEKGKEMLGEFTI